MDVCMHIHTVRKGLEHYRAWGAAQLLFCCCDRNTLTEQLREQRFVGPISGYSLLWQAGHSSRDERVGPITSTVDVSNQCTCAGAQPALPVSHSPDPCSGHGLVHN